MQKIILGISCGDPNGVGLEIALKAFKDKRIFNYVTPVIFVNSETMTTHQNELDLEVDFSMVKVDEIQEDSEIIQCVECWEFDVPVEFGIISRDGGMCSKASLEAATQALKDEFIDALVTLPIHKAAIQDAGFEHLGHTEYLQKEFSENDGQSLMILVGEMGLRVALATNHVPIRDVAKSLSPTILRNKINLLNQTLKRDFGIDGPLIAVLGLNPHAGDKGAIGAEEESLIRPAIDEAKANGINIMGPFPADGFFGSGQFKKFDAILAMYHDQGLVPFKALTFGSGVNFTAGLNIVRTSPDHGTAMNIAGKGEASEKSFLEAVFLAYEIANKRDEYNENHANPLEIKNRSLYQSKGDRKAKGNSHNRQNNHKQGQKNNQNKPTQPQRDNKQFHNKKGGASNQQKKPHNNQSEA